MKKVNLAICDENELYCSRLSEYLRNHMDLAFNIISFTKVTAMERFFGENEAELVLISEGCFQQLCNEGSLEKYRNVIVLDEEMSFLDPKDAGAAGDEMAIERVSKYLPAERIVSSILNYCAERPGEFSGIGAGAGSEGCRVWGFYSPLSRCGQTSLALKMGEMLAEKGKTMLISFESFSALGSMFEMEPELDITDLIYHDELEPGCFCLNLERVKKSVNGLDIIPPAKTALQVRDIGYEKIMEIIRKLSVSCGYENVLLDLTEYPEGFFDILLSCDEIFTITRPGMEDSYRMDKYYEVLHGNGYEDILSRTVKCSLPHIRNTAEYEDYIRTLMDDRCREYDLGA